MQRPYDRIVETLDGWRTSVSQGWSVQSLAIVVLLGLAMLVLIVMQPRDTA